MVIQILNKNTQAAQTAIRLLVKTLPEQLDCNCNSALSDALITHPSAIPPATRKKLDLLVRKYLK
jgi:5'-methylthioadenosine phosphorylase